MNKQKAITLIRLWASSEKTTVDAPDLAEALKTLQAEGELNPLLLDDELLRSHVQGELHELKIPSALVSDIQKMIELNEHSEDPGGSGGEFDEFDQLMANSLQTVQPLSQLREEILKGIAPVTREPNGRPIRKRTLKWWSLRMSAVAAVAALFIVTPIYFNRTVEGSSLVEVREASFDLLGSGFFLDLMDKEQAHLFDWLKEKDLPLVANLPKGLQGAQGFGCKKLYSGGKGEPDATLLCFRLANDDLVHLIIYKRPETSPLAEELGTLRSAKDRVKEYRQSEWVATEWNTSEMSCLLISPTDEQTFLALF